MKPRILTIALLACLAGGAAAQEQAFTNRSTELKDRGAADARTVGTLPADTPVTVLARGGGWTQVQAGSLAGWLRVFHLRFPVIAEAGSSGGALTTLGSALGMGRSRSQQATTATTGIRGLSPEDFRNASPDPEAVRRLQSYRADRAAAERFAREGKLVEAPVDMSEASR